MSNTTIRTTITTPRGQNIGNNIINTLSKTYNLTKVRYKSLLTERKPESKSNITTIEFTFD